MGHEHDHMQTSPKEYLSVAQLPHWSITKMKDLMLQDKDRGYTLIDSLVRTPQNTVLIDTIYDLTDDQIRDRRDNNAFGNGIGWILGVFVLSQQRTQASLNKNIPLPILPQSFVSEYTKSYNTHTQKLMQTDYKSSINQMWSIFSERYTEIADSVEEITDDPSFYEGVMWITSLYEQFEDQKHNTGKSIYLRSNNKLRKVRTIDRKLLAMEDRFTKDPSLIVSLMSPEDINQTIEELEK